MGSTAARMVVAKAELAQSYIVQAHMRRLYTCSLIPLNALIACDAIFISSERIILPRISRPEIQRRYVEPYAQLNREARFGKSGEGWFGQVSRVIHYSIIRIDSTGGEVLVNPSSSDLLPACAIRLLLFYLFLSRGVIHYE